MAVSIPYYVWLLQCKSTYIVKPFKLRVVEDEVHSGLFGKDGAIAQGVSQCVQPWINLGCVCVWVPKLISFSLSNKNSSNHFHFLFISAL